MKNKLVMIVLIALFTVFTIGANSEEVSISDWGATVRPDDNGDWELIDNDYHKPQGIESVSQDSLGVYLWLEGDLVANYWSAVTVDETLASKGVICGARVSAVNDYVYFKCSQDDVLLNPNSPILSAGASNVWVYVHGEN